MNDLRVMLICLQRRGGMIQYMAEVANSLAINCYVGVLCSKTAPDNYFSEEVDLNKITLGNNYFEIIINAVLLFPVFRAIHRIIKFQPDIVHFTSNHEYNFILGWVIKYILKIPIAFTMHDPKPHEGEIARNIIVKKLFIRMPNLIFVHSKKMTDSVEGHNADSLVKVIPHGSYTIFNQWVNADIVQENEILFFGRIELYKGIDVLLEAAPHILAKLPSWKIRIIGNDPKGICKNDSVLPRLEVETRYFSDEDIANSIQRAKIIVFPFRSATQSGSILLAHSFGKAIVTTDVGAIADIIINNKTGLLISPGEVNILSDAIINLATNNRFRKLLGEAGKERVNNIFAWKDIASNLVDYYSEIIS